MCGPCVAETGGRTLPVRSAWEVARSAACGVTSCGRPGWAPAPSARPEEDCAEEAVGAVLCGREAEEVAGAHLRSELRAEAVGRGGRPAVGVLRQGRGGHRGVRLLEPAPGS